MDDVRAKGGLRVFVCDDDATVSPGSHACERNVQVSVRECATVLCGACRREVYNHAIQGLALCLIEGQSVSETKRELRTRDHDVRILHATRETSERSIGVGLVS